MTILHKAALTIETKQRKTNPKQTQNKTKLFRFGFVSALRICETKRWNKTKVGVAYLSIKVITSLSNSNTAVSSTLRHMWRHLVGKWRPTKMMMRMWCVKLLWLQLSSLSLLVVNSLTLKSENTARCGWDQCLKGVLNWVHTICWWPNFVKVILADIITDVIVVCVCGRQWLAETSETVLGFVYFSTCKEIC